jgi:hypothetical protein
VDRLRGSNRSQHGFGVHISTVDLDPEVQSGLPRMSFARNADVATAGDVLATHHLDCLQPRVGARDSSPVVDRHRRDPGNHPCEGNDSASGRAYPRALGDAVVDAPVPRAILRRGCGEVPHDGSIHRRGQPL